MSSTKFSDNFKRDAVAQITERGYPVREVSDRLGVSAYSLYAWKKKFAKAASGGAGHGLGLPIVAPLMVWTAPPAASHCAKVGAAKHST